MMQVNAKANKHATTTSAERVQNKQIESDEARCVQAAATTTPAEQLESKQIEHDEPRCVQSATTTTPAEQLESKQIESDEVRCVQPTATASPEQVETDETSEETRKFTNYADFVANLDLHGGAIRRSSMRHTSRPKLSKWQVLSSCRGVQIYQGFDDMPLTAALEEQKAMTNEKESNKSGL